MREADMTVVADDGVALAGRLVLPLGRGPHPGVVLLWPARSDREGNRGRARPALGRSLAASLAGYGIASYRFDGRGAGATPGNRHTATPAQVRADTAAALRALAGRPEVAATGAIGYGEAAQHAAWLAHHAGAACVVMLAPRGEQTRRGFTALPEYHEDLTRITVPLLTEDRVDVEQVAGWVAARIPMVAAAR